MKLIQNILDEWSFRVPDGMPTVTNKYHLVILEDVLHEKKFPREVIELLLNKLREAEAEVMGATVAQARVKAKDGQTYSSKKAKKVYKKGEEETGGTDQTPKKEVPTPEYLEKHSNTASKVMSNGGVSVLETADEITQSAIDMSAGGIGGPAAFFGESQTTDLINKIGSGKEKRNM